MNTPGGTRAFPYYVGHALTGGVKEWSEKSVRFARTPTTYVPPPSSFSLVTRAVPSSAICSRAVLMLDLGTVLPPGALRMMV